ncbi:hypothetical protein FRC16_001280 [Serendipita sp. 398]|nr:hypothetical protein FRC16_001280 [Serendipita sp. 398]
MGHPSSSRTGREGEEDDGRGKRTANTQSSSPAHTNESDADVKRASGVNFPSVVHIGRHLDGDTDEISVIVCTQRTRRRWNGELPRCYTFGWRHVGNHEVSTPVPLPPKFGQEKEVAGYWKERLIGSRGREDEDVTWTGVDMDDEDEEPVRPLIGLVEKRENWKEGNYVSYGTGSASALEKIQGMHVPLQSYDAHRKAREDLWSAERVAQNMAKHQAKLLKQQMKMEERARGTQAISEGASASTSSTSSTSTSTGRVAPLARAVPTATSSSDLESTAQSSSSSSSSSSSTHVAGPSGLSSSSGSRTTTTTTTKGVPVEPTEETPKRPSQQTPALPPPTDKRFAPDKIPYVPWYRRWTNYRPSPTGWTADEDHGHRSYIIPQPLEAVKNNLMRSWSAVFTPTWKLIKALRVSYASGAQKQIWRDAWRFTAEGEQKQLLERANQLFREHVQRERDRLEEERGSKGDNDRNGNS